MPESLLLVKPYCEDTKRKTKLQGHQIFTFVFMASKKLRYLHGRENGTAGRCKNSSLLEKMTGSVMARRTIIEWTKSMIDAEYSIT